MAEYIERETLQNQISRKKPGPANKRYTEGWNDAMLRVKSMVSSAKAADVAPVRHGRWIWRKTGDIDREQFYSCSNCGDREYWESNFCPNCGAKMDGGVDNGSA